MKKILFLLFIVLVGWLFIRFVLGGSEDSWLCVDGEWVKHGNPSAAMPQAGCEEEKSIEIEVVRESPISEERMIGGDRDEHGCLGPAGYRFSEEIGACIRDWELDDNQGRAAKIAVSAAGLENPTVVEVLSARCPGCFSVTLEAGKNRVKIQLENWQVVYQSI